MQENNNFFKNVKYILYLNICLKSYHRDRLICY